MTTPTRTWYIAFCTDCVPRWPTPFLSEQERDDWVTQHQNDTGHTLDTYTLSPTS